MSELLDGAPPHERKRILREILERRGAPYTDFLLDRMLEFHFYGGDVKIIDSSRPNETDSL